MLLLVAFLVLALMPLRMPSRPHLATANSRERYRMRAQPWMITATHGDHPHRIPHTHTEVVRTLRKLAADASLGQVSVLDLRVEAQSSQSAGRKLC